MQHSDLVKRITEILIQTTDKNFQSMIKYATTIFNQYPNLGGLAIRFLKEEGVMFELYRNDTYFLLELFEDGNIAYLYRMGKEEAKAYDISTYELRYRIHEMMAVDMFK